MDGAAPLLPRVWSLEEYARLRGDPAVWVPAMRLVCRRHGLDAGALYAERTGSNVVFRAGDAAWIKLFPPLWPGDARAEVTGLEAVAADPAIPAPGLLAEGGIEGWAYVVLCHRPGRALGEVWEDLRASERVALAEELGALLARLHALDPTGLVPAVPPWPEFARAQREGCVAQQRRAGASPAWLERLAAWVEALGDWPPPHEREVLLHADVTDEHVLVSREAGRWTITGLLDLGDAMRGDPLYDFAAPGVFMAMRRPDVQHALLRGYGFTPEERTPALGRRLAAHALLHRFAELPVLLRFCPGAPPRTMDELLDALWEPGGGGGGEARG